MSKITITLTDQQLWELRSQVSDEIRRLEALIIEKDHATFRKELAFQKRLKTTLAKAKS